MINCKTILGLFAVIMSHCFDANSQNNSESKKALNYRQENIIPIAAFTATGDQAKLKTALIDGLNAGLTINEIKEILV